MLTGPMLRAVETCQLAGLGSHAEIESGLREWDYGAFEGLTPDEIRQGAPDWLVFRDGCPDGESPEQVCARIDSVISRVRGVDGDVALFAHG